MDTFVNINLLPKRTWKHKLARLSSYVLIVGSLVLIVYPFSGMLGYSLANTFGKNDIKSNLVANPTIEVTAVSAPVQPQPPAPEQKTPTVSAATVSTNAKKPEAKIALVNKLTIPAIGVEMNILESKSDKILYQGAWHIPGTQNPVSGGNMVIGGHRYQYRPPSKRTFYNLDKVKVGDTFTVTWEGKDYNYQVSEIKIVEPKQVEILNNTQDNIVTLFTCTPLFTSQKRLVVIGKQI